MNDITNINKVQEAAIRVQSAAKHVAEAAKENKKTITIISLCVTGVALVGATAYVVTKMIKPTMICMPTREKYAEDVKPEDTAL